MCDHRSISLVCYTSQALKDKPEAGSEWTRWKDWEQVHRAFGINWIFRSYFETITLDTLPSSYLNDMKRRSPEQTCRAGCPEEKPRLNRVLMSQLCLSGSVRVFKPSALLAVKHSPWNRTHPCKPQVRTSCEVVDHTRKDNAHRDSISISWAFQGSRQGLRSSPSKHCAEWRCLLKLRFAAHHVTLVKDYPLQPFAA